MSKTPTKYHQNSAPLHRWRILVTGQVQGVGFRPFVYRLAQELKLTGIVNNTSDGVPIEVQGHLSALNDFVKKLQESAPPLAVLTSCTVNKISVITTEKDFRIVPSQGKSSHSVLISPDTALCADCQKDMLDSSNNRHLYAFTNCTNCGPRYTITKGIPYDRKNTSMACFPLCASCQEEYDNPLDRRFHAQPNACPICGPKLCYVESDTVTLTPDKDFFAQADNNLALKETAKALFNGKILAIKGLGGFHLSCLATDSERIALLRLRKNRPHKPFAIMVKDIFAAKKVAYISEAEEAVLTSMEKPIVLCKRKEILPENLAPDTDTVGIMPAYTPLHLALFTFLEAEQAHCGIAEPPVLVMTSGNAGGEPICLGNREALQRLQPLADGFLLHNRDILVRTDDSVCAVQPSKQSTQTVFYRRARGYVPRPIHVPHWKKSSPSILGMGAELKSCLCLTRSQDAFLSQHVGDLQNMETLQFYEEVFEHLQELLQVKPQLIVHDLHPDFMSTSLAKEYADKWQIPCISLQHHYAHAYAVLAENAYTEPCLALSLDGTGLGEDGSIWGGELLYIDPQKAEHKRLGRLSPFALAGGEKAIQEPWRIALALAQNTEFEDEIFTQYGNAAMITEMLSKNIHCPLTSSAGRLFDAMSAALSLCTHISYEGQAAIKLECLQNTCKIPPQNKDFPPALQAQYRGHLWELNSQEIFVHCLHLAKKYGNACAAYAFHKLLSAGFAHMAALAGKDLGVKYIALSGGVLQNARMHNLLQQDLENLGFHVLTHKNIPPNDACICLGQVYFGNAYTINM